MHSNRISGPETTVRQFTDATFLEASQEQEYTTLRERERVFDYGVSLALDDKLEDSRKALAAFLTFSHRSQHYLRLCAHAIVASLHAKDQTYLEVISDMEKQSRSYIPYELRK